MKHKISRTMLLRCAIFFVVLMTALCSSQQSIADPRLHGLFGDNMVLQQEAKLPVWGWADPGERITVSMAGQTHQAKASQKGAWEVWFKPLTAGTQAVQLTVTGKTTVTVKNILIGEVWLAAGQSNMDMEVAPSRQLPWRKGVLNWEKEVAQAHYPSLRIYQCPRNISPSPADNIAGRWKVCTPETVSTFSAVAYFFGRDLHLIRNVPVGLIQTSCGGSRIEAWMSASALEKSGFGNTILEWERLVKGYDHHEALAHYERLLAEYKDARARGADIPKPLKPIPPFRQINGPCYLYNGMIAPLKPYVLRGIIWYQGESNTPNAAHYCRLFPALIQSWRAAWQEEELPFLFVQLSNYRGEKTGPETDWPGLREAQRSALRLPATAMAVTIDIGDKNDIHPRNKQDVGKRLALAARSVAYEEAVLHSGPLYQHVTREGTRLRIHFAQVGEGLTASDPARLQCFEVAGRDRVFQPALAMIDGNSVLAWSESVVEPEAVRYAFRSNPQGASLRSKNGLPASPFCSDDWCSSQGGN